MRRVGQARRRDSNEKPIVDALRAVGAQVIPISGPGAPDILCGYRGRWIPMEIKTPKGTLKPLQEKQQASSMPFVIVRSVAEALRAIGAIAGD